MSERAEKEVEERLTQLLKENGFENSDVAQLQTERGRQLCRTFLRALRRKV